MFSRTIFIKCFTYNCYCVHPKANLSSRITELCKFKPLGSQISIKGWVTSLRKMKDVVFVDINDGSSSKILQIFFCKSKIPSNLTYGSAVEATGQLQVTPKGQLELAAEQITVIGSCVVTDGYPFVPRQKYPPDYLRQFLHLRPRTKSFAALLRVRDITSQAINNYFHVNGYTHIHTPVITSNDCEGAGEVFTVKPENESLVKSMAKAGVTQDEAYFDSKAFLTVSGQMHLETVVRALSKVYSFGPTFRAENSNTRLHLSEFYMIEAEIAFSSNLIDILSLMETMIKDVTKAVMDKSEEDVHIIHQSNNSNTSIIKQLTEKPYATMTYDEAINILNRNAVNLTKPIKYGQGLAKEHELFLVKHNNGIPIFVVDWPSKIKPFYMKSSEENSSKVQAVDLLTPAVGELCGGSLREDNYSLLQDKLIAAGLDSSLAWYLELRKYGNVPSSGFGMGFERYLQLLLGISNIKDAIPFPRWPHNCQL